MNDFDVVQSYLEGERFYEVNLFMYRKNIPLQLIVRINGLLRLPHARSVFELAPEWLKRIKNISHNHTELEDTTLIQLLFDRCILEEKIVT